MKESEKIVEWFRTPVPAPRIGIRENSDYFLGYASEKERHSQYQGCTNKVLENCCAGVRSSCSIKAVKKCQPNFLQRLLGFRPGEEFDQCQDEYLQVCMAIGTTQCKHHSDEFCGDIFFQNR